MLSNKNNLVFLFLICFFFSFDTDKNFYLSVPVGFPKPEIPVENKLSKAKIDLGKKLFFDPILSRDSSVSCASCHIPKYAYTDGLRTAEGIKKRTVTRNTPTLTNIVYNKNFLRDGVNPSLEEQALVPIHEKNEFDFHILLLTERLKKNPTYIDLFQKAFSTIPTPKLITQSIASFERTLISGNSRYDQFYFQNNSAALSTSEINGMELFKKLNCVKCHSGFNFSNGQIVNNGLYEKYQDMGKMRVTLNENDNGCFKVPTLRNVEVTAPYMHNGSLESLEEVIEHYSSGGKNHKNKHDWIKPFEISQSEKEDLVSFLKSLTDSSFISNY